MPTASMQFVTMINAPQTAVFTAVADLTQHPNWAVNTLTITPLGGTSEVAVGQQYASHAEVGSLTFDATLTVTVHMSPTRFGFKGEDSTGQYEQIFELTAVNQATKLSRTFQFDLSAKQWLMFHLLYWPVRRPAALKALAQLKARLERKVSLKNHGKT